MKTMIAVMAVLFAQSAGSGDFRWTGTLTAGQSVEIRNPYGSIRTLASDDGAVHVEALRTGTRDVPIGAEQTARGVLACAGDCWSPGRQGRDDARVDFVVRMPEGVDLSASAIDGAIDISGLRAGVRVATIGGTVVLRFVDGDGVDFHANTISGRIDADFPMDLHDNAPALLSSGGPRRGGPATPQIVHAVIGGGGRDVQVNTISGDIHLRQR